VAHLEQLDDLYGPKPGRAAKPVVLVEDNGRSTSASARSQRLPLARTGLTVEWLPKYASELNDIEVVWHDLKARPSNLHRCRRPRPSHPCSRPGTQS